MGVVNGNLPDGWTWVSLQDACKIQTGKKDVDEGNPKGNYPFFTCAAVPTWSDGYSFDGESVLLPGNGANVGMSVFYRGKFEAYQRTYVLNQFSANAKYVFYYLQGFWRKHLEGKQYGSAINYVRMGNFTSFQIPLAPTSEQERIVAKIEELFTQLEAGTAALKRVRAGLKRYKASVLKAACEGRLLNDECRMGNDGELPDGWRWTTVGEIGEISGGLTKNSKRDVLPKKLPYLRVANVYANELRLDEVSEIGIEENEIQRTLLKDGDLLVVEGNGSADQIGRVALWNGSISPCLHQNHIIKVRFEPKEVAEYVLYWLLSDGGREQITRVASSTSGLYTLSLSKVANLKIPLPPLTEQRRIVAEVERRLSVAQEVESVVAASVARAGRLRQSVLKSAFEGRLG